MLVGFGVFVLIHGPGPRLELPAECGAIVELTTSCIEYWHLSW